MNTVLKNQYLNRQLDVDIQFLLSKLSELEASLINTADEPLIKGRFEDFLPSLLQIRKSLLNSYHRYERLIRNMSDIVFELAPDGTILNVSEGLYKLLGYLPDEVLGKTWIDQFVPEDLRIQVKAFNKKFQTGDVANYEIHILSKDGSIKTLNVNVIREYTADGEVEKILVFCQDVSDKKQFEDRLRRSEKELAQIEKIAHLGSWTWDIPSDTVTWSEELYRIYGTAPAEGGQTFQDYLRRVHPEDRERVTNLIETSLKDLRPFSFEERIKKPNGEIRILESRGEVVIGKGGKPIRLVGICHDVTEQRIAQQAVREKDELLHRAVSHAPIIFFVLDKKGVIQLSMGKSLSKVRGIEEPVGQSIYDLYADEPQIIDNFERALRGESFTSLVEVNDLALETSYKPYINAEGQIEGVIGVAVDITNRLKAERELKASEERYRLIIENVKEYAIFTLDPSGEVTSWNAGAKKIKGYSAEEVIGQHFSIFYPEDEVLNGKPQDALKTAEKEGRCEIEGWRIRKDGSRFWANVILTALRDDDGHLVGFSKVVRDMTVRKEAEERLRQSEARFRSVFYGAGIGIELVDLDGNLAEFNPTVSEIFGYRRDELRKLADEKKSHHANIVTNLSVFEEMRAGKRDYYSTERPFLHKEGNIIWGRLVLSLVRDAEGAPQFIIGMIEDITQHKKMEQELEELNRRLMEGREAERLHLAQDLHDGPVQDLYSVSYNLSALKATLPPDNNDELVQSMSETVNTVIKTLKEFSVGLRPPTLTPFGLEKSIRSYIDEFEHNDPDLKINLDLMSDGQLLPEQVRLVLYRILQSSFTNTIRHAQADEVTIRFAFDDDQASLEIVDNGRGFELPPRWIQLARRGHLGIVGAIERAEALGGKFVIDSKPGHGTRVFVRVPITEKEPQVPI
jgi:PAS domain S-box-containing protein